MWYKGKFIVKQSEAYSIRCFDSYIWGEVLPRHAIWWQSRSIKCFV